jgi:hypothetical protein
MRISEVALEEFVTTMFYEQISTSSLHQSIENQLLYLVGEESF